MIGGRITPSSVRRGSATAAAMTAPPSACRGDALQSGSSRPPPAADRNGEPATLEQARRASAPARRCPAIDGPGRLQARSFTGPVVHGPDY